MKGHRKRGGLNIGALINHAKDIYGTGKEVYSAIPSALREKIVSAARKRVGLGMRRRRRGKGWFNDFAGGFTKGLGTVLGPAAQIITPLAKTGVLGPEAAIGANLLGGLTGGRLRRRHRRVHRKRR